VRLNYRRDIALEDFPFHHAAPRFFTAVRASFSTVRRVRSRAAILCAAGGKALAAQHWPARLGFERDAVALATLIANNLKPFAFRSPLVRSAKVLTPRVAAGFAALGMAEATLAIVVLFSFSKGEGR